MNYIKAQPAEGGTIRVQNAEGEAVTTARIIVQNEIGYVPKVSVIIPVYNAEAYLRECLDSVVNQTLKKIEIICIDDSSTDNSLSILKEYAQKDPRISVLQQENLHAGVARNAGMAIAKGKYLSFLDADDFFEEDMLKRMCHQAERDGSDIVVCANSVYDDELKQHVRKTKFEEKYLKISPFQPLDVSDALYTISNPNAWTKLFLARQVKDNEVRFESVLSCNDITFVCMMLSLAKRISLLNENLVHYRTNRKASITANRAECIECFIKSAVKLHQNLKKRDILDSYIITYLDRIKKSFAWELSHCSREERKKWTRLAEQMLPPQVSAYITDKEEKISIIIPVYNTEKYLKQCLDSVVNQTLKEIEIICINDGSTDGSLEILEEYAKKDRRVILMNQKNQGLACSRNNALKIARGEYVQFVDSDDLIREDACEKLYKNARGNDLDMLCFSGYNFTETPQVRRKNPYWAHGAVLLSLKGKKIFNIRSLKENACKIPVSSCLTLYRNAFLKKYNIEFPPGLCFEDNVFFIKSLTKADRVSIDPEEYYIRRIREDSITQNWNKHFADYFDITNIVLGYLKKIRLDNVLYDNCKKKYLDSCVRLYQTYGQTSDKKIYLKIKKLLTEYSDARGYQLKPPRRRDTLAAALAFVSLPYNVLTIKASRRWLCRYILARLNTLRIDIKNLGNKDNTAIIEAQGSKITSPGWFRNTQGEGKVLTSTANKGKIKISVIRDGKLSISFRGPDVRFEGNRFPLWIDYKSIKINGKEIFSSPIAVWHDKLWRYEMPVKDGQEVWVEYEQQPHLYSREELKDTILKLIPTSYVIQENIDALTDEIKNDKSLKISYCVEAERISVMNANNDYLNDILKQLHRMRIDIKNFGTKENKVVIQEQDDSTLVAPGWFKNAQGVGQVLTSSARSGMIKISIITAGKLMLTFRGPDVRFKGERFPLWNDYKSIKINGIEVLSSPIAVWHDKPWRYEMPVKDRQEILVEYERQAHPYSREDLKETILRLNPTEAPIQENIDALTDRVCKIMDQATNSLNEKLV